MRGFAFLTLSLLSTLCAGEAPPPLLTDSVIPLIEEIESAPHKERYSQSYAQQIDAALARSAEKVRVVSYNILFDVFDTEKKEDSWPQDWGTRLPRVIYSIHQMAPDILCVQEAYPAQLKDLQEHLGDTFVSFVGEQQEGELNAIFYNKERFEKEVVGTSASLLLPLDPRDDALVARIPDFLPRELEPGLRLTRLHLRDTWTDRSFVVLNTHLTYYRINSREAQVHFIRDLVEKIETKMQLPVIFAGDLNTFPNRPTATTFRFGDGDHIQGLLATRMKDSKQTALLGHVGPESTGVFSRAAASQVEVTLDHIYVSPEVTVLIHGAEPSKVDGEFPSDHLPIIADLILP